MAYTKYKDPWSSADTIPPATAFDHIEDGIVTTAGEADVALTNATALANKIKFGNGSPETVVTAPVGTIYLRLDGIPGATFYIKGVGASNTGWSAI